MHMDSLRQQGSSVWGGGLARPGLQDIWEAASVNPTTVTRLLGVKVVTVQSYSVAHTPSMTMLIDLFPLKWGYSFKDIITYDKNIRNNYSKELKLNISILFIGLVCHLLRLSPTTVNEAVLQYKYLPVTRT